ncbi:MAG: ATP-binding cassette domain-containing protein, partial [Deltaproteobacteria bacterium]|nr:ATP-binding cassette domain-containing protein [Deltaproteobacteria bacterium]
MLEIVELVIGWRGGKGSPPSLGPFTLSVRPGEVIGLAGPSGCGKTMLLRCLGGESSSHGGELRWQGRSLTAAQRRDRRLVGYLGPAEPLAATGLDVRRTLELAARLLDQPRQRVNELLEQFALGECAASPLARLSSGLEERLRLALLELPRPSVVLLDRPLAQLDRAGNELL